MNESEILTGLGRFEEAHAPIERALAIWRQQDVSGFLVGYGLIDRGKLELAEGRPRAAVATLEKALALIEGQDPALHRRGAATRWRARCRGVA